MSKAISEKLTDIQSLWDNTEAIKPDILPDGEFSTMLDTWTIGESKQSKILQSTMVLKVMEGPYEGKKIYKFSNLTNETGIGFFEGDIEILGVDYPDDISMLPDVLADFAESFPEVINVRLKTKGEYQNVYILGTGAPV